MNTTTSMSQEEQHEQSESRCSETMKAFSLMDVDGMTSRRVRDSQKSQSSPGQRLRKAISLRSRAIDVVSPRQHL